MRSRQSLHQLKQTATSFEQAMLLASQQEQAKLSLERQIENSRQHSEKLLTIFGDETSAWAYLDRYEKMCIAKKADTLQLVHDACSFKLPTEKAAWTKSLWKKIIQKYNPTGPDDYVLQILPYAAKIEEFAAANPILIEELVKEHVETEYKKSYEFSDKNKYEFFYNKVKGTNRDEWIADQLRLRLKSKRDKLEKAYDEAAHCKTVEEYQRLCFKKNERFNKSTIKQQLSLCIPLSEKTPLKILQKLVSHCVYTRAKENPAAAALFFSYYIEEDSFNLYLDLKPVNDDQLIPPVTIQGKAIHPDYKNYELFKLDPSSPDAALLGKMTSCCQWLGGQGETCAIHGITDPHSGFYVLRDKITNNIVAQAWTFRSKEGFIVFDSIETHMDFRKKSDNAKMTADFFFSLANKLTNEHTVPKVTVGMGGATDAIFAKGKGMLKTLNTGTPINYTNYSDSDEQYVLSQEKCPYLFALFYKALVPRSWNIYLMSTPGHLDAIKKSDKKHLYLYQDTHGIYYQMEGSEETKYLSVSTTDLMKDEEFDQPNKDPVHHKYKAKAFYPAIFNETSKHGNTILNSNLTLPSPSANPIKLNEQESKEWCDMCYLNSEPWNIKKEYPVEFALSDEAMDERYCLSAQWAESLGGDIAKKWASLKPIAAKVNINVLTDNSGLNLAITWAANSKAFNVVRDLIAMGADIPTDPKENILYRIMLWWNWDLAKEIVDVLIQRKEDLKNIRDKFTRPLLHNAVAHPKGYDLALIKKLVENGVEVDALDNSHTTALHYACLANQFEVVSYLIAMGANVNHIHSNNSTTLHSLIWAEKWDMVKFLIESKADTTLKNFRDETAIDMLKKMTDVPNEIKQLVGLPLTLEEGEHSLSQLYEKQPDAASVIHVDDGTLSHQDKSGEKPLMIQNELQKPPIRLSSETSIPTFPQSNPEEIDCREAAFSRSQGQKDNPLINKQYSFFDTSSSEEAHLLQNSTANNQNDDTYPIWLILLFCIPIAGQLLFVIYKLLECCMPEDENESHLSSSAESFPKRI